MRDDRPFAGPDPPAAVFFYSRNRAGEHPARHLAGYAGILQADAYAGFGELYDGKRKPAPITEAACWSHGRRKFFELADLRKAPLAVEAVRRIDELFAIEREINGLPAADRLAARQRESRPIVADLETWMRAERARLSRHAETAKAIDYMLTRWPAFTRFLDDGRICLSNNAAERALRGIALGRRAWLFAGSDRGGERAAAMYTLIATAKLNDINPQAWLADVLARIADHPASRLHELLPWHWKPNQRSSRCRLTTDPPRSSADAYRPSTASGTSATSKKATAPTTASMRPCGAVQSGDERLYPAGADGGADAGALVPADVPQGSIRYGSGLASDRIRECAGR